VPPECRDKHILWLGEQMDKEQATNKMLAALSRNPEGLTTKGLSGIAKISDEQTVHFLLDSDYARKGIATQGGSVNLPPTLWKLKHYVPGSAKDEDLKRRIAEGSA
jgi:hypothetical protein